MDKQYASTDSKLTSHVKVADQTAIANDSIAEVMAEEDV